MKARIYGTDTVLLIVAILDDEKLAKLYNFAKSLGMELLVEVNSKEEMTRAIKLGAKVDLSTTSQLAKMVHEGEAIMKAQDKKAFIDEILGIKKVETKPTITKSPITITATELGADLIGVIFAKDSRRKVTLDLSLEIVNVIREMQSDDSNNIKKEDGESEENINDLENLPSNYDWFRSHADTIYTYKKPLTMGPVIKAFHIDEHFCAPTLITQIKNNKDVGQTHEGGNKGLNPENVKEAIEKVKPWCVDASSGVETDQQKNNDKIKEFIQRAKSIIYKDEIIETEEKSQDYEKQNGKSINENTM
nr:9189_t:CDS:2 [Entrophospora candida]